MDDSKDTISKQVYERCIHVQEASIKNLNTLLIQFERINQNNDNLDEIKDKLSYSKKLINSLKGIMGVVKNRTLFGGRDAIIEFKNKCKLSKLYIRRSISNNINIKGNLESKEQPEQPYKEVEIEDKILESLQCIKDVSIKFKEVIEKEDIELENMEIKVDTNKEKMHKNITDITELLK